MVNSIKIFNSDLKKYKKYLKNIKLLLPFIVIF